MKYLSDNVIKDKRVLLRCDFNVSVKNNKIIDNSKIISSLKTIEYLLNNNNKVIIFSHFGRVKNESDKEQNSLKIVYEELKKYIDLEFIIDPFDLSSVNSSNCKCFLVENTRFTDIVEKRESANDLELAKYWASFGDVFVLDAFASSHRVHASVCGIAKYLECYIGLLMEKEINNLDALVNNTRHPFTVIMGGAKVDDKIKIIESLLKKCDKLIITGGILNTFLRVSNFEIGNSLVSEDNNVIESVKKVLSLYSDKLFFANKFKVLRSDMVIDVTIKDINKTDIIYDNIPDILNIINDSELVFLNGTSGKYEDEQYSEGTFKLLKDLADAKADVYVGGGDTLSAVNKFGFNNSYRYMSTGGGATLEYVADGKLKALEWIKENGLSNDEIFQ